MKKGMVILGYLCLAGLALQAQGVGNLFSQKQADINYLLKQVALLQVYIGDVEKGYRVAREGLTAIGEIKNGELSLHSAFFNSLEAVNPAIKKYSRVGEIVSLQVSIVRDFKAVLQVQRMSQAETNYLNAVFTNMMTECDKSLKDLTDLITDNTFKMQDDERIKRIDGLYQDMKEKYAFTESFTGQVSGISVQRRMQENQMDILKALE